MRRVLVVSAVVHAAIFACIMHAERRTDVAVLAVVDKPQSLDVEVEAPTVEQQQPTPTADEPASATEQVAVATPQRSSGGVVGGSNLGALPGTSTNAVEAPAGANTSWVVDLGAGAVVQPFRAAPPSGNAFSPNRKQMEAEENAINLPHKDDTLKHQLSMNDAAKGLGVDGPVLHALEDETRMSLAPNRGTARFRAVVDATGTVTSLSIEESTGDSMGWKDARDKALAALQKKKLDLRGAKNGAMFDIQVESKMRMPDGTVIAEGESGGVISGFGGGSLLSGDLSNIGAKPQRIVHAHLTSYTPL